MQLLDRIAGMNFTDKITSFEQLGLLDPESERSETVQKSHQEMESLKAKSLVYKEDLIFGKAPPRCSFVPDKDMLRKMIRTVAKCKTKAELCDKLSCK